MAAALGAAAGVLFWTAFQLAAGAVARLVAAVYRARETLQERKTP